MSPGPKPGNKNLEYTKEKCARLNVLYKTEGFPYVVHRPWFILRIAMHWVSGTNVHIYRQLHDVFQERHQEQGGSEISIINHVNGFTTKEDNCEYRKFMSKLL